MSSAPYCYPMDRSLSYSLSAYLMFLYNLVDLFISPEDVTWVQVIGCYVGNTVLFSQDERNKAILQFFKKGTNDNGSLACINLISNDILECSSTNKN